MQYRTLVRGDTEVSVLALGTDNFANPTNAQDAAALVRRALDGGITLFDTANTYANGDAERMLGRALGRHRTDVLIATKAYYPTGPGPHDRGNSRRALHQACEASLKRLETDYVDLFQLHRPDFEVPMEETMGALHELVESGKARMVGSSTAPAWRTLEGIKIAEAHGWRGFATDQPPYNILDRRIENELVPMATQFDVGLLPWSPLAMGMLAGRYQDDNVRPASSRAAVRGGIYAERVTPAAVQAGNRFVSLAKSYGHDPAQLAICWVKDQPAVAAPVIGPKTVSQLEALLPVGDMIFPEELRSEIDRICSPGSAVADFHNSAEWMAASLGVD